MMYLLETPNYYKIEYANDVDSTINEDLIEVLKATANNIRALKEIQTK